MTEITIALLIVTGVLAMVDWRQGLAMSAIIGIAQDPLRKLAPGQPIYYVILVGVVFGVAWLRAYLLRVKLTPAALDGWRQHLKVPFTVFIYLVLAQALHSFLLYRSLLMSGIGLLVWLGPIPAVLLAYQFALRRGLTGIRRWMILYSAIATLSLSGVYLEYAGYQWPVLGAVGTGLIIYDVGVALKAFSGFFRSSEIAAWHGASIACFIFILSVGKRPTFVRVGTGLLLIALLISLGVLTGRRKMLVEVATFMSMYMFLVALLQRGTVRTAVIILTMGVLAYFAIIGMMPADATERPASEMLTKEEALSVRGYAARSQTAFADIPDRVSELGIQPILWSIDRYGWLGAGLGTGTQGAQQVVEENNIYRGAAEGGLGKVTMELGVPGLLIAVWLFAALGRYIRGQLVITTSLSKQHARVSYGLVAFIAANAATFSVATQAYSDLFVLLILGWSVGFLLAMPALALADAKRRMSVPGSQRPAASGALVPAAARASPMTRKPA
jgi:hypothetical protein